MNNIIDSIQLSGTVYTLSAQTGGGGVPESAFTAYTAATDERISQDEEVTAAALNVLNESLSGKQDTLSAGTNITISGNVISAEGGGKSIEAGRGISVTTGETADTVSFNLPISAGTGTNSIIENNANNIASGNYSHVEGRFTKANGIASHAEGYWSTAATNYSHAEGNGTVASGVHSHTEGNHTVANNQSEHASGQYNVSSSGSSTWGDSGNTLFSVGNGDWSGRHNAFEIRQNGDIYLTSGGTDIKLQDHLGGGGSVTVDTELDSGSTNPVQNKVIYNKIDEVEQVTAAGLNALNDKITPTVELTQAEYDALTTKDPNTYYIITDAQAVDLTNYYTKSETNTLLGSKQATLVSGTNIKTINNESILGSGNIDIQGGGVDVVQTTGTSTTDVMSQDAVTTQLNGRQVSESNGYFYDVSTSYQSSNGKYTEYIRLKSRKNDGSSLNVTKLYFPRINGNRIIQSTAYYTNFEFVETSAITTSITSGSTDAQVPSAKAVYDKFDEVEQVTAAGLNAVNDNFGGLKLVKLTQVEYNALATKDSSTLYIIVN